VTSSGYLHKRQQSAHLKIQSHPVIQHPSSLLQAVDSYSGPPSLHLCVVLPGNHESPCARCGVAAVSETRACRNIRPNPTSFVKLGRSKPHQLLKPLHRPMSHQKDCQQRKRQREQSANEADESQLSAKRQKRRSDNYPPHVWDNLSKITLTRKALREFDRRIRENRRPQVARVERTAPRLLRSDTRRLERLASNGGPDLSKLRGVSVQWQFNVWRDAKTSRSTPSCRLPGPL
jgi:hypothetical protein